MPLAFSHPNTIDTMHKALLCLLGLTAASVTFSSAQLNVSLVSQLDYPVEANDIWGWVDPDDSTEYALVGLQNGVSIVSLADPANPLEVANIPGQNSTWRDLKTWGNFAYVTTDQPGTTDGLLVIDLSPLPDSVTYANITEFPGLGSLFTCHNLYIDENGICYLAGCEQNAGGILLFDVASDPGNPVYLGASLPVYAHDVYTRNHLMYASEIFAGNISIYDVSDPTDVQLLGSRPTDFTFTHNAWLSDDGNTVFTTDERANAPVGAYDVSDPTDIVELDQFRPSATVGSGVIPHNVHVFNDYLVISHYTDGLVIADAARPANLVEVGIYDTWSGPDGGFNGAWGAYPFLPSGRLLVTDIQSGLFVLEPDYQRGCYLEGVVRDAENASPLNGVEVVIAAQQANVAQTDLSGAYQTGLAMPGTYTATFTRTGYEPHTDTVTLERGVLTPLDVSLQPLARADQTGSVVRALDGQGVEGAEVILFNEEAGYQFRTTADANGNFTLEDVFVGNYTLVAGAWGYFQTVEEEVDVSNPASSLFVELDEGYEDDFILDLGWETVSTAATGAWERAVPIGTGNPGALANPGQDVAGDVGNFCYVTGNGGGTIGSFDVDGGRVTLISPPMDLRTYEDPVLRFDAWFFNDGGSGPPDDTLKVFLTNGIDTALLLARSESSSAWQAFEGIHLADVLSSMDNLQVLFETSDLPSSGHLVEAGVDAFRVEDVQTTASGEIPAAAIWLNAAPVPFRETVTVSFELPAAANDDLRLRLTNSLGQIVLDRKLDPLKGQLTLSPDIPAGWYVLGLYRRGALLKKRTVLKTR